MDQEQEYIVSLAQNYLDGLSYSDADWPESVQSVVSCIHEHLFNSSLSVSWVKDKCHISKKIFSARFAQHVGYYPKEYILHHRIAAAKKILQKFEFSVTQIALAVGFNSLSAFCKAFKRETGWRPTDWRAEVKEVA